MVGAGPCFGRARELARLRNHDWCAQPLVTLSGPGGIGKTRLLDELLSGIPGATRVDLDGATDCDELRARVAAALGVDLAAPAAAEALATAATRASLLALDNVDPLAGEELGRTLLSWMTHGVRVLATSRVPLGVDGERVVPLAPLAPDEAAALFVARARAAGAQGALSPDGVARLVELVDGLPLALELLGIKAGALPLEALEASLAERVTTLSARSTTKPARHRSLRACFEGSYASLSVEGRRALRHLGLLCAAFDLSVVAAMLDAPPHEAADLLEELVVHGLAVSVADGRHRLLAPVRELARDAEHDPAEDADARERRARYFYSLLEADDLEIDPVFPDLGRAIDDDLEAGEARGVDALLSLTPWLLRRGPDDAHLQRLRRAAALATTLSEPLRAARAHLQLVERLIDALRFAEASAQLDQVYPLLDAVDDDRAAPLRVRALGWSAHVAAAQSDLGAAEALLEEALPLARALADPQLLSHLASEAAGLEMYRGNLAAAVERSSEALVFAEQEGDLDAVGTQLVNLGTLLVRRGAFPEARERLRRALTNLEADALVDRAHTLELLGYCAIGHGETREAIARFDEARAAAEAAHLNGVAARIESGLGLARLIAGDLDDALEGLHRSARRLQQQENDRVLPVALAGIAIGHALRGEPERAAQLLARARSSAGSDYARATLRAFTGAAQPQTAEGLALLEEILEELFSASESDLPAAALRVAAIALTRIRRAQLRRVVIGPAYVSVRTWAHDRPVALRAGGARAVLRTLVDARREAPAARRSIAELFSAAWPDEKAAADSARNRVHVALSALRKAGLKSVLLNDERGYHLDPDVTLVVEQD